MIKFDPSNIKASPLAVVLGVNGQDGSYLAEELLTHGWRVIGVGKQTNSRWVNPVLGGFVYEFVDLRDPEQLLHLLRLWRPQAVFHLAALHGPSGFSYENHWQEVHLVNTLSAHAVLEYLRVDAPDAALIYASSSKVFQTSLGGVISEATLRASACIYSTTKNAATDLIIYYRKTYGIKASVTWMFNHESPRRQGSFFLPRVVKALAGAILDEPEAGAVSSLSFWADWTDARDLMRLIRRIAKEAPGQDFILASGETIWAEDFVATLYGLFELSHQDKLKVHFSSANPRPPAFYVDNTKLQSLIGDFKLNSAVDVAVDILRINYPQAWERCNPSAIYRTPSLKKSAYVT